MDCGTVCRISRCAKCYEERRRFSSVAIVLDVYGRIILLKGIKPLSVLRALDKVTRLRSYWVEERHN
jgi:hypothetical protein